MKKILLICFIIFCSFNCNSQIVNIPDANFKTAMLTTACADFDDDGNPDSDVDINNDGEIEVSEALQVFSLFYTNPPPLRTQGESNFQPSMVTDIADLTGIEAFLNLKRLDVSNNLLTTLDVSMLPNMMILRCGSNSLTSLNISNLPNLEYVYCENNDLASLNLFGLAQLKLVHCSINNLVTLDVSNLTELFQLSCAQNPLLSILFQNNPALNRVYCNNTLIDVLDLSDTSTSLLYCGDNPNLTQIFLKNGVISPYMTDQFPFPINTFNFDNTPMLEFICGDDPELDALIQSAGPTVNVNSYCTFNPGGEFNTIAGNVVFDCGGVGIDVPNAGISINDGTQSAFTFSNQNGDYSFFTNTGTFTGGLLLGNPGYFNVAPANFTVDFTTTGNTSNFDFCLSANGVHPDLEISLLPTGPARPGFDAQYLIFYKNKGTETQSGTISFEFDDSLLDFISAIPATSTQNLNMLTWDFSNLMPFETRSITIVLNVNSPVETPPVNIGDILPFSVGVSSITDETPNDNLDSFNQVVVGSYDPNDKIVVEGEQISIAQIGDYLHYMIRFQNTGTTAAQNVIVKDVLTSLLDASTLQVIGSSHAYYTSLTSGNKLEFFFENINLPAVGDDEPGSHGYIAFRIKPAGSVTLGSIIQNAASIYFDFNFAIVTNTVNTTVTALGVDENELSDSIKLYPNPAGSYFSIGSQENNEIELVSIYNMLGQLVKSISGQNLSNIDVSNLTSGSYIVEVKTIQGTVRNKLLKV